MKRSLLGLGLFVLGACSPSEQPLAEVAPEKEQPEIVMTPKAGLDAANERGAKLAEETIARDSREIQATNKAIIPLDSTGLAEPSAC